GCGSEMTTAGRCKPDQLAQSGAESLRPLQVLLLLEGGGGSVLLRQDGLGYELVEHGSDHMGSIALLHQSAQILMLASLPFRVGGQKLSQTDTQRLQQRLEIDQLLR